MRKDVIRKGLVLGIIVLFVGASVVPLIRGTNVERHGSMTYTPRGDILYVGGGGPGNYTKIQDAIDNASDGDTVFVFKGTYNENLVVNKTIDLVGEDRNTTVIDRSGYGTVINVEADYVNISSFTINNDGDDPVLDSGVEIRSNYTFIFSNRINSNKSNCIILYNSFYSKIYYNTVSTNFNTGIALLFSGNNTISWNQVIKSDNYAGIRLLNSTNNTISQNVVSPSPCYQNIRIGILLRRSSSNIISRNIISRCSVGIQLVYSNNNIISDNEISSCTVTGVDLFYSNNNTISRIVFSNHSRQCIRIYYSGNNHVSGCYLCNNIDFENNTNNYGLLVEYSHDNIISDCVICNNSYGIMLKYSDHNNISRNIIEENYYSLHRGVGIFSSASYSNTIYHNNFKNNPTNAFFVHLSSNKNKWIGNYWDRSRILPKLIIGGRGINIGGFFIPIFPRIEIDWNPAQEPYEIQGGN